MWKINHFKEVCKSAKSKKFQSIDPQDKEHHHNEGNIDKVNINSININPITFNSKCSVITTNLNTSLSQATWVVPYKVDSLSNGNIMPFHILKKNYSLGPQKKN